MLFSSVSCLSPSESVDEFSWIRQLIQRVHQGLCGQSISDATTHETVQME